MSKREPPREESLVSAYERLRTIALGLQGAATADLAGWAVLRRQGMVGWIEAQRSYAHAAASSSPRGHGEANGGCPAQPSTHADLVVILTNMVLIAHSQAEAS